MDQLKVSSRLGIQLGGVWQDFHDSIKAAEDAKHKAEEELSIITVERNNLQTEKDYLLYKFRESMASLTDTETNHMEAMQIIEKIKQEKVELVNKCLSLETQRDWLEEQNRELKKRNEELIDRLATSTEQVDDLKVKLAEELKESKTLNNLVFKRDEGIEDIQKRLKAKAEEIDVLNKSLATKDRQFQAILKERNRIKDEVTNYEKIVHKFNGLSQTKQQQHHIQLREDTPKLIRVDNKNRMSTPTKSRKTVNFVSGFLNSKDNTPIENLLNADKTIASDSNDSDPADPYSDMFTDLSAPHSTPLTPPPPPSVAPTTPVKEVKSPIINQFITSKSTGLRDKLNESLLNKYREELQTAREEIERLEAIATNNVQQRRIIVNATELRKHQLVSTPPCHMTRRTSPNNSPVTITCNSNEKVKKNLNKTLKSVEKSKINHVTINDVKVV